jgi:hypothetical protein
MAKICRPIVEYKDIIPNTGISIDDYTPQKKIMKRFIRLLKDICDSRMTGMIDYPLYEVILIAFLAVLAGASTWDEISQFGEAKKKWLKKFIPLQQGIPSHDTFRRVFALINPEQLQKATVFFLIENMTKIKKSLRISDGDTRIICIDGKEQRGTGRKHNTNQEIRNLQTLHVYDASNAICLCSKPINAKNSNYTSKMGYASDTGYTLL